MLLLSLGIQSVIVARDCLLLLCSLDVQIVNIALREIIALRIDDATAAQQRILQARIAPVAIGRGSVNISPCLDCVT